MENFSALILPLTIVKVPSPFQQIHPHIIGLTLAPRPGLMHCSIHSSPRSPPHKYYMVILSNDHFYIHQKISQFQSPSTFQCLFPLAHATHLFMITFQIRNTVFFLVQHACDIYYGRNKHLFTVTVASETGFSLNWLNLWVISFKGLAQCFYWPLNRLLIFFFLPPLGLFSTKPLSRYRFINAHTVHWLDFLRF